MIDLRSLFDEAIRQAVIDGGNIERDKHGKAWVSMTCRNVAISAICHALEDTGSPAHMRVAAELRGE